MNFRIFDQYQVSLKKYFEQNSEFSATHLSLVIKKCCKSGALNDGQPICPAKEFAVATVVSPMLDAIREIRRYPFLIGMN